MKYVAAILVSIAIIAVIIGVTMARQSPPMAEGRFSIEIEEIYEGSDLFAKRLHVTARGATGLRVRQGKLGGSWVSLESGINSSEELQQGEVLFVADRSMNFEGQKCGITWLSQVRHAGNSAGGPSRHIVPAEMTLDDFISLELPQGEFAIGETLSLGTVDGEPLELTVE